MTQLKRPYTSVENRGSLTYGGSQMLSARANLRKCACGPVAALDLLYYLQPGQTDAPVPLDRYNRELEQLTRRYFPLIPSLGINGLLLVLGLNRLFRDRRLPYHASWAVSGAKLWERVEELLRHDIPAILAVGPNFPGVWMNRRLSFYVRTQDGRYVRSAATKGHYVTATGIDREWVQISSWGRRYFINRTEYEQYVRKYSSYLFSNLVYIRKEPDAPRAKEAES